LEFLGDAALRGIRAGAGKQAYRRDPDFHTFDSVPEAEPIAPDVELIDLAFGVAGGLLFARLRSAGVAPEEKECCRPVERRPVPPISTFLFPRTLSTFAKPHYGFSFTSCCTVRSSSTSKSENMS
jgi:hypothetical protein